MTYAFLICIVGLVLWLIFTHTRISTPFRYDGWAAEVGKIMFGVGLLAWLLLVGGKTIF